MTEKKSEETGAAAAAQAETQAQTKIIWDDSEMRSVYANATNAVAGREEFLLLFGVNQAWHPQQREIRIQLQDRVILSPFAAKRLSVVLNNVVKDYENRYGTLEIAPAQPPATSVQ
jgi:hypothetical protein